MSDLFAPVASANRAQTEAARSETVADRRVPRWLTKFAGVALISFPVLFSAGMVFSPQQTEEGDAGYIASLAADPATSELSANLLHHSWVALALGVMGLILLVGQRGRLWVSLAAVGVAFGSIQMSGLLLSDWFLIAAGNVLTMDQAVLLNEAAKSPSMMPWFLTAQLFSLLGLPVLMMGLARAKVVSWWLTPLPLVAFFVPVLNIGIFAALAFVPLMAPVIIAGVKLFRLR